MADENIVYGAACTWWDDAAKAAQGQAGICCPHCKGVLFQTTLTEWHKSSRRHVSAELPDYVEFIVWLRGRCYLSYDAAYQAFKLDNKAHEENPAIPAEELNDRPLSNPFLELARFFGADYGAVLSYSDYIGRTDDRIDVSASQQRANAILPGNVKAAIQHLTELPTAQRGDRALFADATLGQ
jgi:hypothetical protein